MSLAGHNNNKYSPCSGDAYGKDRHCSKRKHHDYFTRSSRYQNKKKMFSCQDQEKRRLAVVIPINNNKHNIIFYHAMKAHDLNTIIIAH